MFVCGCKGPLIYFCHLYTTVHTSMGLVLTDSIFTQNCAIHKEFAVPIIYQGKLVLK